MARTAGSWNRTARQNFMENDNPLRAQDGYPVYAVNLQDAEAAFNTINAPADPNRFRYQVLLSGLPVRSIHEFLNAEVNGINIIQPKSCDRCEVKDIDQQTGEFILKVYYLLSFC